MRWRRIARCLLGTALLCLSCDRTEPTRSLARPTEAVRQPTPAWTAPEAAASPTASSATLTPVPTRVPSAQAAYSMTVRFEDAGGKPVEQVVNYLLYTPAGYGQAEAPQDGWPLVLFLHGQLEWGDDPAVLSRQGVPKLIAAGQEFPALVVAPQSREGKRWWPQTAMLVALLEVIQSRYDIDPRRVYLTGISMGGYGAWALAMAEAPRLAAVVPIAGGADYMPGDAPIPETICNLRDVPVWAFHGELDVNVPVSASVNAVRALEKCGGSPRLTLYADAAHTESWERAYADPELWTWLFAQRRK